MATKTKKKFDPRFDQLESFKLPKLYVVGEVTGAGDYTSFYNYTAYTNKDMAEWHAADLRAGDTERVAKSLAKLKGMEPLTELERKNHELVVRCGIRDIRVLESDVTCDVSLQFKLK